MTTPRPATATTPRRTRSSGQRPRRSRFGGRRGKQDHVIKGVSFDLAAGETLSLVGESGSGKTTIGRAILGLAPVTGGAISFRGQTISNISRKRRRQLATDIQVIFQDPYSSLNPSMTVETILVEPLKAAGVEGGAARVRELLDAVRLPRTPAAATRGSSPAASASGWPSPVRWP